MTRQLTTLAKKKLVVAALEDIKARDIQAIDVRKITSMFDWIVVASADSARQTKALARHVRDKLKEAGCAIIGTEGEEGAEWVLVDSGDIVAHIMQPAVRSYYNLEELWGEGKFDRPANAATPLEKPLRREGKDKEKPAPRARRPKAAGAKPATRRKKAPAGAPRAAKPRRRKPAA
ncbi:MAG TPA: ribosome silencing factor [Usitatibacteraceae bacterium]|nr:ribosome silencing factor [Usitatibacteraceae bacterium]